MFQSVLNGEMGRSRPLGEEFLIWELCCDSGPLLFAFPALRFPSLPPKPHLLPEGAVGFPKVCLVPQRLRAEL